MVRAERQEGSRPSVYEFKPSPYSSHILLLGVFPEQGAGKRVLDLGCGDGHLGSVLAGRGFDVVGVEMPGVDKSAFPADVKLVEADLENGIPEAAGGSFDYILCADVLEHLRNPLTILRQIPGLLAEDGRLVASLPNSGNIYFRLNILIGRFPQDDRGLFDRTHLRFYMWDGWLDLLKKGGFAVERVLPSGIPVGLGLPRWKDTAVIRLAEAVCYDLARFWRTLFAYQFVVVAAVEGEQ